MINTGSKLWAVLDDRILKSSCGIKFDLWLPFIVGHGLGRTQLTRQMRYIAAYLLLQIGGNGSPGKADIEKVVSAAGADVDEERLDKLLSELEGKDINALIAEGIGKLASVPSGGGAVASGGGAPAASGGAAPAEEKKEEKKEEEKEESDDDMGFGLFD